MSFTKISLLGFGGTGIPDTLPQAVTELQRAHLDIAIGVPAGSVVSIPAMAPDDTIVGVANLTMLTSIDRTTVTPVEGGFTCTTALSGSLLVLWFDHSLPKPRVLTAYQHAILASGPLSYWPLDDSASSPMVTDLVGNRNGTVVGTVGHRVAGIGDSAMQFTGAGYVEAPALPLATSDVSIELWYRAPIEFVTAPDGMRCLFSLGFQDDSYDYGTLLLYVRQASGLVETPYVSGTSTQESQPRTEPEQWHHYVLTYEQGTDTQDGYLFGTLRLYHDGVHITTEGWVLEDMPSSTAPIVTIIGAEADALNIPGNPTAYRWQGLLQDVVYYPRLLTGQEIAAHYKLRVPTQTYLDHVIADGASHVWRLNEIAGTRAWDTAAETYNGTVSGGVQNLQPGAIAEFDTATFFEGTGRVIIPKTVLEGMTSTSWECWMLITEFPVPDDIDVVLDGVSASGADPNGCSLYLWADPDLGVGNCGLYLSAFGRPNNSIDLNPFVVPLNTYCHVVMTVDAVAHRVTLYANGVVVDSVPITSDADFSPAADAQFVIGYTNYDPSITGYSGTIGSIDEVAIYPRALTAAQVAAHYAFRKP